MGRNHLILLFDTESQSSSKQIWIVLVGTKYLSFVHFFNFVFNRLKHFVNHFWFSCYVIQQTFIKIFNLLHTLVKKFFIFSLTFVVSFAGLQCAGCKSGVGSFRIGSSKMLLFVLLISPLPSHVSNLRF